MTAVEGPFDVAVVGAGVVGAAIARELARHELGVALVEAGPDVGGGTSKANTAILHTGFDTVPGSLEAKLVTRGYALLQRFAAEADVAVEPTGALLVAWNDEQLARFPEIKAKALENGVQDVSAVSAAELYASEPHLGKGALGALRIPGEGIICPYTPPLAFAYDAVQNGCRLFLNNPIADVTLGNDAHQLRTPAALPLAARWVVNAAGLASDTLDRLFGHPRFKIVPRRGQLIVYDKFARRLIRHVLLPVPTKRTKGVLVSPTVFGNVLLGPTAEDLDDKDDRASTAAGVADLIAKGKAILPELVVEEVTAVYAGLRAATEHQDYQIHLDRAQRYVVVGGIRSTGLSASLAIAEYVRELLSGAGLAMRPKVAPRSARMPNLGEVAARPMHDEARIAARPAYGRIVCHCEKVTLGELEDAFRAPVPARTLDGLRRRTRCLQGRCQGFYCLGEICELAAREFGVTTGDVLAGGAAPRAQGRP